MELFFQCPGQNLAWKSDVLMPSLAVFLLQPARATHCSKAPGRIDTLEKDQGSIFLGENGHDLVTPLESHT